MLRYTLSVGFLVGLLACSAIRPEAAPDSGFLEDSAKMVTDNSILPFHKSWMKDPSHHSWQYRTISVAPVDTTHLEKSSWMAELGPKSEIDIERDAKKLAQFVKDKFETAIRNEDPPVFTVVDSPGDDTLIIELAIVELIPTDAYVNGVANIAGFFIPGSSLVVAAEGAGLQGAGAAISSGSVAIEGRFRDAKTKETIAMFADRRTDKIAPIDLAGLTWYSHAHDEIEDWADEVNEWITSPGDHKVSEASQFTLLPW